MQSWKGSLVLLGTCPWSQVYLQTQQATGERDQLFLNNNGPRNATHFTKERANDRRARDMEDPVKAETLSTVGRITMTNVGKDGTATAEALAEIDFCLNIDRYNGSRPTFIILSSRSMLRSKENLCLFVSLLLLCGEFVRHGHTQCYMYSYQTILL